MAAINMTQGSLVDVIVDAAKATQAIYERNGISLAARNHMETCVTEFKRAALMEALANDDNLCEMLAGRISQISHGVPSVVPAKT